MDGFADDRLRAFIAKARVAEMQARGWRILGPGEEGSLWMEGPAPDGAPQPLATLAWPLVEALRPVAERRRAA